MSELNYQVLNTKGSEVGSTELDPDVFGARIREKCVHMVVRYQLAKRRAGTHSTLTRSNMKGGGRKPFKQKGTGHARQGSIVSPLMPGGAVLFGPSPRSYEFKVTKAVRRVAMVSALSDKVRQGALRILDELKVASGRTQDMRAMLQALGVGDAKVLVVLPQDAQDVVRASRNLPNVVALPIEGVNVYDLVRAKFVVSTQAGIEALQARLARNGEEG